MNNIIELKRLYIERDTLTALLNDDYSNVYMSDKDEITIKHYERYQLPVNSVLNILDDRQTSTKQCAIFNLLAKCYRVAVMIDLNTIDRLSINDLESIVDIPRFMLQGRSYTTSGYGSKIPTSKKVKIGSRWYRVYCKMYSNIGGCYIVSKGRQIIIDF